MFLLTPTSEQSDDIQNHKAICFFIAVQGGVPNVSLLGQTKKLCCSEL